MSLKNKMLVFGLRSTSDDWPSDQSNKSWLKCKKTPKSSRNGMLGFGLCSTSDDRPSDLNDKCWPKHKKVKKGPLCQWKIKCSFMDDVQLLMISWAIWATNVDWNAKKQRKAPMSLINQMFIFGLHSTSDDRLRNLSDERQPKCKKMKKGPLCHQNKNARFWIMFNFWWSAEWSEWQKVTEMWKKAP